jgi:multidrug efflux pump subunit AcrA (membrane-fusion protein)
MYVETDDLTEIEVVDVQEGQKVTVVADALPGVEMNGTVESINQVFEEKRGDITYTVRIALDNPDPRLRWGMTVVVTFEE